MSGDPLFTPLLVGLGLRQLSLAPNNLPAVKAVVRRLSVADAERIAAEAMTLESARDVRELPAPRAEANTPGSGRRRRRVGPKCPYRPPAGPPGDVRHFSGHGDTRHETRVQGLDRALMSHVSCLVTHRRPRSRFPTHGGAMPLDKVRIRFRKSGDLRLVSHLDLMRSLERLLRRAAPAVPPDRGLSPHAAPRAGPIAAARRRRPRRGPGVGADRGNRPGRGAAAAARAGPAGDRVPLRPAHPGERHRPAAAGRVPHSAGRRPPTPEGLADRIAAFLGSTESWAERERPKPRAVNIRPYVESLTVESDTLMISCWLTQEGRPGPTRLPPPSGSPTRR